MSISGVALALTYPKPNGYIMMGKMVIVFDSTVSPKIKKHFWLVFGTYMYLMYLH